MNRERERRGTPRGAIPSRSHFVDRSQKEAIVASLHRIFAGATLVVVIRHSGLTVAEASDLRRQMRAAGAAYRVIKNRLARRALEGTGFTGLTEHFVGPTSIAFSSDPVAAAKVTVEYAKRSGKIVVLGGALGDVLLDPAGVGALASLPSLDALRAKLIGLLQAPAAKLAGVLQAPAGQLARVLNVYGSQDPAA